MSEETKDLITTIARLMGQLDRVEDVARRLLDYASNAQPVDSQLDTLVNELALATGVY